MSSIQRFHCIYFCNIWLLLIKFKIGHITKFSPISEIHQLLRNFMSIKTFTCSRDNRHENNFTRYQFLFHLWQINCVLKRREFLRSYEQDCNKQVFWHNHIWNLKLLHKWVEMVVFWRQYFFIALFHESDLFNTDFNTAKFTVKSILMAPTFDLPILVTTATWQCYQR